MASKTHDTYVYYSSRYVHEGQYGARTAADVALAYECSHELGLFPNEIRVYDYTTETMTSYWPNGSKRVIKLEGKRPMKPLPSIARAS